MRLLYKIAQAADVPRQICIDTHGPRRGVALRVVADRRATLAK